MPKREIVDATEHLFIPCWKCGTAVDTRWTQLGMLDDFDVTLVADWIFHTSCWNLMIREDLAARMEEEKKVTRK